MQGVFITGTDTAVGKTTISCQLTVALRHLGVDVAARKPIEQRCKRQGGALYPTDGLALAQAAGEREPIDRVTPYRLAGSISPAQTAQAGGNQVDLAAVIAAVEAGDPEIFRLVEGAGGFLSPLTIDATNADLAAALGFPVIVVAANRSGCINHSRLTVEAIRNRGLEAKAVVINAPDAVATDGETYRDDLAAVLDIPVIACRHGKMDWEASSELARIVRPRKVEG